MTSIALSVHQVIAPRFEFPAWVRRISDPMKMLAPLGGALTPLGVSALQSNVLTSVPWVAQWRFNGDGNDSIGANNLTNVNTATFTTGKLGGATGATQLARTSNRHWSIVNNANILTGDVDFLVAAWVYLDSKPAGANMYIAGKASNAADDEWGLLYRNFSSENRFAFVVRPQNAGAKFVNANTLGSPALSTWYWIVAWHDSTNDLVKISVNNGAADSTATAGFAPLGTSAAALYIGNLTGAAGFAFDGRIDNVCYAKGSGAVPTQTILDALYNNGNGTETLT